MLANRIFPLFFQVFCLLFCLLISCREASSQEELNDQVTKQSWTEGFTEVPVDIPGSRVLVALTPKNQLYPTFNVISMPYPAPTGEEWSEQILTDYHKSGLVDTKVISTHPEWAYTVDLSFKDSNGIELVSRVSLIPDSEKHHVLTFLIPRIELGAYEETWIRLVNGATETFKLPSLKRSEDLNKRAVPPTVWAIAALLVLIIGYFKFIRSK